MASLAKEVNKTYNLNQGDDNIRKFLSTFKKVLERSDVSPESLESDDLVLTSRTDTSSGFWSETKGLRRDDNFEVDLEKFEIERITTNANGGKWLKYKLKEEVQDVKTIKDILSEIDWDVPKVKIEKRKSSNVSMYQITDVHIGMSTEGALWDCEWGINQLNKRLDKFAETFIEGDTLIINQLGDLTDGIFSRTSRGNLNGGHKLKQNMNDKEMFKNGVESMKVLLDKASQIGSKVVVNWLTNSNHPSVMDYNIGETLNQLSEYRWDNVEINVIEEFIYNFELNGYTFLLSHGYDSEYMTRGLPKNLKPEQAQRIENYILKNCFENVVLLRGDQHQFQSTTYSGFRDIMTPAFSPPSGWVSMNFMTSDFGGFTKITFQDGVISNQLFRF